MKTNTIICGDCLEYMRDMPDNSVDLVLTDPQIGTVIMPHGLQKARMHKAGTEKGLILKCMVMTNRLTRLRC
jgi:DNA modification methylase